jgi:TonB family protein
LFRGHISSSMTVSMMLTLLLAQVTPPTSATPCSQGPPAPSLDQPYIGPTKGAPPYFAVVDVRVNPEGSIKWTRIYKSSGIPEFDEESLEHAKHVAVSPTVGSDCKPVDRGFYFVNAPRGYSIPQWTPNPRYTPR